MILACRLLSFRANRLANIIAGGFMTLVNGYLTFVAPLTGAESFAKGVPTARVVRVPNADYYVYRSNEAQVIDEMMKFLNIRQ